MMFDVNSGHETPHATSCLLAMVDSHIKGVGGSPLKRRSADGKS